MGGHKGTVLIVDAEPNALKVLSAILTAEGFTVRQAGRAEEALSIASETLPDVLVTDIQLPDQSGLDLFAHLSTRYPDLPVVFLTAYGTVESAVKAMASGACHYFLKPPDYGELIRVLSAAAEQSRLKKEVQSLRNRSADPGRAWLVIGESAAMQRIYDIVETVKDSVSSVLVTGETGTGKELIARALHYSSRRKNRPFIAVNCAAIPDELLEAELFGHEKGAFTGAAQRRVDRIEAAAGGTLFLDEIGELNLTVQSKLLRVLQEKEFSRLGNNRSIEVDFRLIAATNRDLRSDVAAGKFREDLFYRIDVVDLRIPPLRERREDIPLLVKAFLAEFTAREGKSLVLADDALRSLADHEWPGNVRELRNVIERMVVLAKGRVLSAVDLPAEAFAQRDRKQPVSGQIVPLRDIEKQAILNALAVCAGNKSKAARKLGLSRKSLYMRLRDYEPA